MSEQNAEDTEYERPSEDKLMGPEELREYLGEKMSKHFGTDDLTEANRRARVLHQWRDENGW